MGLLGNAPVGMSVRGGLKLPLALWWLGHVTDFGRWGGVPWLGIAAGRDWLLWLSGAWMRASILPSRPVHANGDVSPCRNDIVRTMNLPPTIADFFRMKN